MHSNKMVWSKYIWEEEKINLFIIIWILAAVHTLTSNDQILFISKQEELHSCESSGPSANLSLILFHNYFYCIKVQELLQLSIYRVTKMNERTEFQILDQIFYNYSVSQHSSCLSQTFYNHQIRIFKEIFKFVSSWNNLSVVTIMSIKEIASRW